MDEFWEMKAKHLAERTLPLIVVDVENVRELYYVGEPKAGWQGRGHGGAEFIIELLENGMVFSCRNLWHSGTIPKKLWDQFQPNAKFLELDEDSTTTPLFWDCECATNFHHNKNTEICPICKAIRLEQPDAMRTEVKKSEIDTLWLLARGFLSNHKHKCRYCGDLFVWQEGMDPYYCSEHCRKAILEDLYANVPPGVGVGINDAQSQVDEQ